MIECVFAICFFVPQSPAAQIAFKMCPGASPGGSAGPRAPSGTLKPNDFSPLGASWPRPWSFVRLLGATPGGQGEPRSSRGGTGANFY